MARHLLLLVSLVLFGCIALASSASVQWMSVIYSTSSPNYRLVDGRDVTALATARYEDTLFQNGWGRLYIQSNPAYSDEQQMFAAGMLEGALTAPRIYTQFLNINTFFFGSATATMPVALKQWLEQQDKWTRDNIKQYKNTSPYWGQVAGVISQFDGLVAGYKAKALANETLDPLAFSILNGVGDLLDLKTALVDPEWKQHINPNWIFNTHCSALVKVTGDLSELFVGHTSWFLYSAMNRIAKEYHLPLRNPTTAAKRVIFSSYPGFLESLDDFYITDQNLVVSETSLSVFNKSLYAIVRANPNVLLSWQRTLIANRMSTNGAQWAQIYSNHTSGTYNNQWMVIDYKQFVPKINLKSGTLTVLEQIPGTIVWDDMTPTLIKGYWPSYNVPYFTQVYERAGYIQAAQQDQVMASYQTCCRANIFRRDQGTVRDLESFKHILRYNDWQSDPYSQGFPGYSIASRFDLAKSPDLSGGIDTKVTSAALVPTLSFEAINGPTYQQQPVFTWDKFESKNHYGLPTTYDFPFVSFSSLSP